MNSPASLSARMLEAEGRVWFRQALPEVELQTLERLAVFSEKPGERITSYASILRCETLNSLISSLLTNAKPVRALVFNKTPDTNWLVPWHQDRVIAVHTRETVEGYSAWTQKSGVWHCEPPIDVLSGMVFARIHFNESTAENGCLRLANGSHKFGAVPAKDAERLALEHDIEICEASRGDVLIVKALTLHCSGKSVAPTTRRTLRVDYANKPLPEPLQWAL